MEERRAHPLPRGEHAARLSQRLDAVEIAIRYDNQASSVPDPAVPRPKVGVDPPGPGSGYRSFLCEAEYG
jgi:hypothetical protein